VPALTFTKYHGLQNDFVVLDRGSLRVNAKGAARLCHRRRGIGADGILSLLPAVSSDADFQMHVFNADGSEAEMCGNGLRCVVQHHLRDTDQTRVKIDTGAGLQEGWRVGDDIGVTLGAASLIAEGIVVDGLPVATGISMGNPHLVLPLIPLGESVTEHAQRRGPDLERHPRFPERVNVGFPQLLGANEVRLVVFERGSGITDACGTGAGACVAALARRGLVDPALPVNVHLPGGPLQVRLEGEKVSIIGEAIRVYGGTVELAQDELQ
jgi:diaminopimelate epimerase